MEDVIGFTIHTVQRNKVKMPVSLRELRPIFEQLKQEGFIATEHQNERLFANKLRKYGLKEENAAKPCECLV